jgi:hypothetical protein
VVPIIVLLTYAAAADRPFRDSPERLFALWWGILLGGYVLFAEDFVPLTVAFQLYLLAFFASFAVTVRLWARGTPAPVPAREVAVDPRLVWAAIVVALVPFLLAGRVLNSASDLMDFRMLLIGDEVHERQSIGIGFAFPIACGGWYVARYGKHRLLAWLGGLAVFGLSVLSTSKIFLVLFLLFLIPWWDLKARMARWVVGLAMLGLGVFFGSQVLLEKFSSSPDDSGLAFALGNTLRVYLFGGVAAFQQVLTGAADFPQGAMWKPIGDVAPGLVTVPESSILPWTEVGTWQTNVYSAFGYWFDALGFPSAAIMGVALGALYGSAFRDSSPSMPAAFYRTFLLFPLLFTFHQDFFLPSLAMHVGFLGTAFLMARTVAVRPEAQ